jgi:hypothetical protein
LNPPDQFSDRRLELKFDGRRITVADLLEAASRVLSILREVDARTTLREGGSLDWIIRDLNYGSAELVVEAEPQGETTPVWAPAEVPRIFAAGMRQIVETGTRPDAFSETAMRRAYELTSILSENGIRSFTVGRNGNGVSITPELRKPVRKTLEGPYLEIGTIEGYIDSISAHDSPYSCHVYSVMSGEPVRCYFDPAHLDLVHALFKKRASVRGVFNTRANGEITSMRARSFERMPSAEELPTVDDILGILVNGD